MLMELLWLVICNCQPKSVNYYFKWNQSTGSLFLEVTFCLSEPSQNDQNYVCAVKLLYLPSSRSSQNLGYFSSLLLLLCLFFKAHTCTSSCGFSELGRGGKLVSNKALKRSQKHTTGNHRKWLIARENSTVAVEEADPELRQRHV